MHWSQGHEAAQKSFLIITELLEKVGVMRNFIWCDKRSDFSYSPFFALSLYLDLAGGNNYKAPETKEDWIIQVIGYRFQIAWQKLYNINLKSQGVHQWIMYYSRSKWFSLQKKLRNPWIACKYEIMWICIHCNVFEIQKLSKDSMVKWLTKW